MRLQYYNALLCFPPAGIAQKLLIAALGMPCIYYGTEQAFDGYEGYHDASIAVGIEGRDWYTYKLTPCLM